LKSDKEYFNHILEEIIFLIRESDDLSREFFEKDQLKKRAFVRSIEIADEAVKNR
jgi:uncharacterized protein with HEPN domain